MIKRFMWECIGVSFIFLAVFFFGFKQSGSIYSAAVADLLIFVIISLAYGFYGRKLDSTSIYSSMLAINSILPIVGVLLVLASAKKDFNDLAFTSGVLLAVFGILADILSMHFFTTHNKVSFLKTSLILLSASVAMLTTAILFVK
ncbi:MAG: hypothetical protein PHN74_03005 [Candidatus Pacebacteria bacterium]|nr:hypothetical protein [Candidatus Paceibacterota bacterium]